MVLATGRCTAEIINVRKSGETFPAFLAASLLQSPGGRVEGVMGVSRDITKRKRAQEDLDSRNRELEALFSTARILAQPGNFEGRCKDVLEELAHIVEADRVVLRLADQEKQTLRLVSAVGVGAEEIHSVLSVSDDGGLAGDAFQQMKTIVANDYAVYPGALPEVIDQGINSGVGIPISARDMVLGTVIIVSKKAEYFTPQRIRLIESITQGLGALIENARLQDETEGRAKELEVISEMARIITSSLDIDRVYEQFLDQVKRLVDFDRAVINIVDEGGKTCQVAYQSGQIVPTVDQRRTFPLKMTALARVSKTQQTLVRGDLGDGNQSWIQKKLFEQGLRSSIIVPLISKGSVGATFALMSRHPEAYGQREQAILERLAPFMASAMENSRLYQETKQLALAMESIGDAVTFIGLDSLIKFANKAAQEMYGYTSDEMLGQSIHLTNPAGSDRQALGRQIDRASLEGGWKGELKKVRKNGEEFDASVTNFPVRDRDGAVIGSVSVAQDISERKRAEERMRESSRLIALGELAAVTAHELNNPLTAVLGFAQLLEAQDLAPSEKEDVKHILTAAQRAADVIRNMLSLARKHEMEKERLDITKVVERVLEMRGVDLKVDNVTVKTDFASGGLYAIGDQHRLEEVFLNIVTNAQQAMSGAHQGGRLLIRGTKHVPSEAEGKDEFIRISITDNGPGIEPEHLQHIFDPFFTTKGPDEGTGLGLSICRSLVQQQGGRIWVESEVGKGATVHVELPASESQ